VDSVCSQVLVKVIQAHTKALALDLVPAEAIGDCVENDLAGPRLPIELAMLDTVEKERPELEVGRAIVGLSEPSSDTPGD